MVKMPKRVVKKHVAHEEHSSNLQCISTPPTSPKKQTSYGIVTPPKQRKLQNVEPLTPSTLLNRLDLNTDEIPQKDFQTARKALHNSVPSQMPGREKELSELQEFVKTHMTNGTSASLYISGPPGTGKTAALSIILEQVANLNIKKVLINCTSIKSSRAIYARIFKDLEIKGSCKTEKDYINAVEKYLTKTNQMVLVILDEIDQLDSKNQTVLYTIFEWPAKVNSKLILIGIANALDLTDRILPRLQMRCELKPKLMHFSPYTKQQIVDIFMERLKSVNKIFPPSAMQVLAGKVAAVSGDIRRALDIGRRVLEIAEQEGKTIPEKENMQTVDLKQVINVLNSVYGTSHNLNSDCDDTIPLQQRIIICSLLLIIKKANNKDITIGKLHEVYKKVCQKKNLSAVDQAEFVGLCSLIETKGIIHINGKKEPRLHKVTLQWDEDEVVAVLKDKQFLSSILEDDRCLGRL